MKANTNFLVLLEAGCTVQLPNGVSLAGQPDTKYIELKYKGDTAVWSLDKDGLKNALDDADKLFADYQGDDFSDLTGSDGYIGGIGIKTGSECQDDQVSFPKGKKANAYNIVNEDGEWLLGAATRVEIRRKFVKFLERV